MDRSEAKEDKSGTPSFGELKREVEDILPFVQSEADEAEQLYHLTDRLVAEFRRRGLYTVITPKAIGGVELPFVEAMELVERVSWADASTGWCMMVLGVQHGSAGTFIPDEGIREIYPDGADVTMAGQGVPRGYARRVDGGYVIKGLWGYGSAIYHAEWVHSGCFLMDGDDMKLNNDGSPMVVIAHHPRDSIELKGNWDSLGLRGTGSFDYTIKGGEVFVPDRRCHWLDNPAQHRGGTQYSSGITGLATWGHTSWALGVGRRTLDELAGHARNRVDAFGKLHDSPSFKQSFADAEAKFRSVRAFVYGAWDDLCETFAKGEPGSNEQIALIRLAMRHIHNVISEISTMAHRTSGGVSLRPSVLQRCYRDIHSGTQHILLSDEIAQDCGKVLLGVTSEKAEWKILGLMER